MTRVTSPVLLVALACASSPETPIDAPAAAPTAEARADAPFAELRARPTALVRAGPAPAVSAEGAAPPPLPAAARAVRWERAAYPAGGRQLAALIARPPSTPVAPGAVLERLPALVIVHGGAALAPAHLSWAGHFVDAGFVVLFPTLRGANGNPGAYELMYGELDDVKAAARFLAQEPDVDVDRMYAVGHETGGGLCALLAVDGDAPFRAAASIGGVYSPQTFAEWARADAKRVPFDPRDATESRLRALSPFVEQVRTPLVLYVSAADTAQLTLARSLMARAKAAGRALELVDVASVDDALARFAQRIAADALTVQEQRERAARVSRAEPTSRRP